MIECLIKWVIDSLQTLQKVNNLPCYKNITSCRKVLTCQTIWCWNFNAKHYKNKSNKVITIAVACFVFCENNKLMSFFFFFSLITQRPRTDTVTTTTFKFLNCPGMCKTMQSDKFLVLTLKLTISNLNVFYNEAEN